MNLREAIDLEIFNDIIDLIAPYKELIYLFVVIICAFIIFNIFLRFVKRFLLKKVRRRKQVSNVFAFLSLLKFLFAIFIFIVVIIAYYGNWGEIGFIAGLLTVALGMALQKPISGVIAWIIIISRRPFGIGDRIEISNIKGEVTEISLAHIYLEEIGGTILGEEKSNRSVMLPTSIIFEQEVVNYTEKDDYILDEVTITITYESNMDSAEMIMINAVKKIMKTYWKSFPKKITKDPHIRLKTEPSGVNVTVRYYTIATSRNEISTKIIREILRQISRTRDVEIAYPHTQILMPENKRLKA